MTIITAGARLENSQELRLLIYLSFSSPSQNVHGRISETDSQTRETKLK